jgi:hypothetical protein
MNNNPENIMKKLESYGKETGFTVPDGYYDDLYTKMMGKIAVEKQKTTHRKQLLRFSLVSGAAATVALLITLNFILNTSDVQPLSQPNPLMGKVKDSLHLNSPSAPVYAENSAIDASSSTDAEQRETKPSATPAKEKSASTSKATEKLTDETTVLSVMEFYEEDARSDEFTETLMDLECYYDF